MAEVWPYPPLNAFPERLSWLTSVDTRRDDESRFSYRSARQTLDMTFRFQTEFYLRAEELLASNIAGDWLVPLWGDGTATAVTGGDDVLTVETAAEYYVGGRALIWGSWDSWEVVDVTAIDEGELTIYPAAATTRTRCFVMPLREALIRDGAKVKRLARESWELSIAFEAQDNPDLTLLFPKLELELVISASSSMATESSTPGFSRMEVAKVNAKAILSHLERTGVAHDVQVVFFNSASSYLRRNAADAGDFQDLRDFVDSDGATAPGQDLAQALANSGTFFNSSGRRVTVILSDASGTNASSAAAVVAGIAGLEVYGLMIGAASTTALELVDNTEQGVQKIDDGNDEFFAATLLALLELPQGRGVPLLECSGAVLNGGGGGQIIRATSYLDSGLGPVETVVERSVVERSRATTLRRTSRAGRWELKKFLHFVRGRSRPFFLADLTVTALDMTETTATVADGLLPFETDWEGRLLDLEGQVREILTATLDAGVVILTFDAVQDLPAYLRMRILRRARMLSDELELEINRATGWTTLTLEAGGFDGV